MVNLRYSFLQYTLTDLVEHLFGIFIWKTQTLSDIRFSEHGHVTAGGGYYYYLL